MVTERTGGRLLVDCLLAQGVDTAFGVPGESYLAVKSSPRGTEPDVWRVQAAQAGVTLSTTPSIAGLDGVTLGAKGDWVEAHTASSFQIVGTGRIQRVSCASRRVMRRSRSAMTA